MKPLLILLLSTTTPALAQIPFAQSDIRVIHRGTINTTIEAHADEAKNLSIRVSSFDGRSSPYSILIKGGFFSLPTLKACIATEFDVSGLSCSYTWLRTSMPVVPNYIILITLKNGISYEFYGKWYKPLLNPPVTPLASRCLDNLGAILTSDSGEPLLC